MSNLMTDNDRDVAHSARSLHATFKRTPLRMTGGAGLLDINGTSSGPGRVRASTPALPCSPLDCVMYSFRCRFMAAFHFKCAAIAL
jgi:hypothetical protein